MWESHRRVVIATDAGIDLRTGLAEHYQILIVPRLFRAEDGVHLSATGPKQFAMDESLSEILPARAEDFINAYSQVERAHIVTIHLSKIFDNAADAARKAQSLLGNRREIQVFEAKTTEAGVGFLVETVSHFIQQAKSPSPDQVVSFLKQVGLELGTYLFVEDPVGPPIANESGWLDEPQLSEGFGRMFQFDAETGELVQVQDMDLAFRKMCESGYEVIVQWQRSDEKETSRNVSLVSRKIGAEGFEIREVYSKNRVFPRRFIGFVRVPNSARIESIGRANNPSVVFPRLLSLDSGKDYALTRELVHIGRSTKESSFWGIDLAGEGDKGRSVSRHHATVIHQPEDSWILEVSPASLNETFVNGALVKKGDRRVIADGDELALGDLKLLFRTGNSMQTIKEKP